MSGGGEMGELTRAKDWTQTPLGDPTGWPQSLRTTLGILLNSNFPMFLFWGKDLIQFYNDAYRPSLGNDGKHPLALGQKAADCWPEIWGDIKPLIDQVLSGKDSTWSEDQLLPIYRNGRLEDVYWTFSYSPVSDEAGAINGVLVVCTETTGKVSSMKRIAENESQLKFTLDAAELGTWDLNPATNKFIGNSRIKEWFGLLPQDEIDLKNALDAIVPNDRERVTEAIKNALRPESGGNYEIEYTIVNSHTGHHRSVLAKGKALFAIDGTPVRFSGILQDINDRKNMETALRISEEKFRNTVSQAPIGIIIMRGSEFIMESANETYLQIVDRKKEELVGTSLFHSMPEVKDFTKPILDSILATGEPYYGIEFEVPLKRFGHVERTWFNFVYHPLRGPENNIDGIMVIATEVTAQVKARHGLQESEIQFRNMVDQSPIAMTIFRGRDHIIELANNTLLRDLWRRRPEDVLGKKLLNVFPELRKQKFPGLLEKVLDTGIPYKENEAVAFIDGNDGLKKFYLDFEYAPLFEPDKSISGVMVTVNDVTEKVEARQQIKEIAERLLLATEGTQLATWDINLETSAVVHSPRLAVIFGHDEKTVLNHTSMRSQFHPADLTMIVEKAFDLALKKGEYNYEARIIHPDKSIHWIRTKGKVIFDETGAPVRMLGTSADISQQKSAEEQLASLAQIVTSSDDAIMSKSLDGIITSWNDAAQKLFGYAAEEIIGKEVTTLIPEHKLHEEDHINSQLKNGRTIEHFETMRRTKDGDLLEISLTVSPIKDSNGKVIGASKIARDITKQKQNERLIAESKQQMEIVIGASGLGTWELLLDPRQITYSPRHLEILGLNPDSNAGYEEIVRRLHPDDFTQRKQAFLDACKNGILHYTSRVLWEDNSIHWVEASGKVFYDNDGKPFKIVGTLRDLTEEKTTQQRIAESEQRFRSVADTAPVLIWMAGKDKGCTFFNKAWLNFRGRTIEQELANGWAEGVYPDDLDRVIGTYVRNFELRKELHIEYRLLRHDGEYRWISVNGVPRFTADNIFEGYIGACMDIHDRIVFEEKLKESESRLRIAALSGELGTWDYNPETTVLVFDNASRELFGVSPEETVTVDLFFSKIHPHDIPNTLKKMKAAMDPAIAENYDVEYRVTGLPDDKLRWIHAKGKALFNDNNIPYLFSGTVLDITEKKLALEELQENEQRYRFLANAMPQFVWTGDSDGLLTYFNDAVYEYSGMNANSLTDGGWLEIVHPEDREENVVKWMHSIATGDPFLFEHRFKRHDGVYRWQLSRAIAQKDEDGRIQMWVGTSTDIDEIKKHEQQKNDFIKMANHELKTPVTTIKGYVQLLLKTHANSEDTLLTSSLITVDKQVTKLTNLVSDLLDVTKIERGSLPLNKEIFELNELVNDTIKDMQAASQTHDIVLANSIPASVLADKDRISQVLINLFTNAFKYSPAADKVVVDMCLGGDNDIIVSVQDFGIGIASDDQGKIFERFYRVAGKDEKTFPGFGIGLFIVNEIMLLHTGKLWVHSQKEKGSTFFFSLPIHKKNSI